ncbi:hypothetical protein OHS70_16560 [Streptomyces sp. NBC_00390]|uniref:hypothetical protein n=1 Tax=Streptomyces sp. NBC_00390 TaxID=2975736 RepID=UPI002E1A78E9
MERLTAPDEAERRWAGAFAAHQGEDSVEPLHEAARFLATAGCLRAIAGEGPTGDSSSGKGRLQPTALGRLTSRFMVDAALADELTAAVREAAVPENAFAAEQLLAALLGTRLPTLEQAPFTDRARAALRRVLRDAEYEAGETGAYEESGARAETGAPMEAGAPDDEPKPEVGDLARAVLLLVAGRPRLFRGRPGYVLGIPVDSMTRILRRPGAIWPGSALRDPSLRPTRGWRWSPGTSRFVSAGAHSGPTGAPVDWPPRRTRPASSRACGTRPVPAASTPPTGLAPPYRATAP